MKNKLLLLLILISSIINQSFACTCVIPTSIDAIQDYEYENSEFVFIGEVFQINVVEKSFKVKIVELFKGREKEKAIIKGIYNEQCGPIIDEIGEWLLYANLTLDNTLKINECGLSRSLKNPEQNTIIDEAIERNHNLDKENNHDKFILETRNAIELEIIALRKREKQ